MTEPTVRRHRTGTLRTTRLGLDLARTVAQSVGAQSCRRREARPGPGRPTDSPRVPGPTIATETAGRGDGPARGEQGLDHRHQRPHLCSARWSTLVGGVNAAHSHPESYADTDPDRTDRVDRAGPLSLRTIAPQLVARLNDQLGDGTVDLIKVLRPGRSDLEEGPEVRTRRPRPPGHLRMRSLQQSSSLLRKLIGRLPSESASISATSVAQVIREG